MVEPKKKEETTEPKNTLPLKENLEQYRDILYLDLEFNGFIVTNSYNFNSLSKFQKIDIPTLRTRTQGYLSFIEERLSEINDKNSITILQNTFADNMCVIYSFLLETQQKQEEFSKILFEEIRKANFLFIALNVFWHLTESDYETTEAKRDLFSNKTEENKEIIKNSVSFVLFPLLELHTKTIINFNKLAEWAEKSNTIDEKKIDSVFSSSFSNENLEELKKQLDLILDLKQSWLDDKDQTKKIWEDIWALNAAISLEEICHKYFKENDLLVKKNTSSTE